ncbi:hypothetical protein DSUL_100054 [Desulfovibrionales bacterium]
MPTLTLTRNRPIHIRLEILGRVNNERLRQADGTNTKGISSEAKAVLV